MTQFPIGDKKTTGLAALHQSPDLQHELVVEFEKFLGGRSVHVRDTYLDEKLLPNLRDDTRVRLRVVKEWDPDQGGRVLFGEKTGSKIGGGTRSSTGILPTNDDTTAKRAQNTLPLSPDELLSLLRNLR